MTRRNRRRTLRLLTVGLAALAVAAPAAQAAPDPAGAGDVAAAPALPEDVHLYGAAGSGARLPEGVVLRRSAPPAGIDAAAPVSPRAQSSREAGDTVNWTVVGTGAATLALLAAGAVAARERRARVAL